MFSNDLMLQTLYVLFTCCLNNWLANRQYIPYFNRLNSIHLIIFTQTSTAPMMVLIILLLRDDLQLFDSDAIMMPQFVPSCSFAQLVWKWRSNINALQRFQTSIMGNLHVLVQLRNEIRYKHYKLSTHTHMGTNKFRN